MYLGFDTETTGKFDFKAPPTASHQPRLVQLGLVVLDEQFRTVAEYATLIKPDGTWNMESGAAAVHGISEESCERYGVKINTALAIMGKYAEACEVVFCHNYKFDNGMIARECASSSIYTPLANKKTFCTMQSMTNVLKLPGPYGNKWPKLQELHHYFFGHEFEAAHDAMADVKATAKCFIEIAKRHKELLPSLAA